MKPNRLLLLLLLAAWPARAAVDPFYQTLLREGEHAYDRKDYQAAAHDLRLACFGMLDEPRQLADCLARLALAQDRLNDVEAFRDTFQRLVEIEERFKAYSQAELTPELRGSLEQRLAARLPAATLAGAPAFRSTIPAKPGPAAIAKAEPPKKEPAKRESVKKEPAGKEAENPAPSRAAGQPVAPANGSAAAPGPATPATAAPTPPATNSASASPPAEPPAPKPLTDAERGKLEQARRILAEQRSTRELRQAYQLAREVADVHPEAKEAQHLAAEGAYRISRWSDAATYFRRGGDPGEGEPERLFYMAVALYESGDRTGAAAALKRSLANLQRTPYVDAYAKKILGQ
jgi:tetratricopeptide (TPR) repeat protein